MRKKRPHYAPEFRRQMVELVRAGRSPAELENEFEPTAQTIRKWVAQGDRDELGPVKMRPGDVAMSVDGSATADLDRPCARRRARRAGRDGGTGSAGAEQRNWTKQEDTMPSDQIP